MTFYCLSNRYDPIFPRCHPCGHIVHREYNLFVGSPSIISSLVMCGFVQCWFIPFLLSQVYAISMTRPWLFITMILHNHGKSWIFLNKDKSSLHGILDLLGVIGRFFFVHPLITQTSCIHHFIHFENTIFLFELHWNPIWKKPPCN